jgi:hypothetical protein
MRRVHSSYGQEYLFSVQISRLLFWEVVAGSILAGFLGMVLALLPGLGLAEIVDLVKWFFSG